MKLKITQKFAWRGGGSSGQRGYVGCYDGYNWGMRYAFRTPDTPVTAITLRSYWFNGSAANLTAFPVRALVSTDPAACLDKNGGTGHQGTLRYDPSGSYNVSCTLELTEPLAPDTDHWLFLYPDFTTGFRHYIFDGSVTDTTVLTAAVETAPPTVTADPGILGKSHTVTVSHPGTLTWACGSDNGTMTVEPGLVSWTPPVSLAAHNTTGDTVEVALTLTVGDKTAHCTAAMTIPEDVRPALTDGWVTVTPVNDVEGITVWVAGRSRAQVTYNYNKVDTSGCWGAAVASAAVTLPDGTDANGAVLAGETALTATVTDTRGRTVSQRITVTPEPYAPPRLSDLSVYRSTADGTADGAGDSIAVCATGTVSPLAGENIHTLTAAFAVQGADYGAETDLISGQQTVLGAGEIAATSTYVVRLTLTDRMGGTARYTALVPTEEIFFMGLEGGRGAAFGKYAEQAGLLDVAWDLRVLGTVYVGQQTLKDYILSVINGQ